MNKSEKLHKEIHPKQILFDANFTSALVTPPSFHHLCDEMPPPLSGEASRVLGLQSVFYEYIFVKYKRSTPINLLLPLLPPLKGEVAKIDNFNCQFLTEGSGQQIFVQFHEKTEIYSFTVLKHKVQPHSRLHFTPKGSDNEKNKTATTFTKYLSAKVL